MSNNVFVRILMLVMAGVIGYRIVDHFDYSTKTFEQPAMDIIFGVGFILALFVAFRKIGSKN